MCLCVCILCVCTVCRDRPLSRPRPRIRPGFAFSSRPRLVHPIAAPAAAFLQIFAGIFQDYFV